MSNFASPPQLVEGVPYRDLEEMHAFARRWRDEHRGQWFTAGKLSGFCLLLTRAVYEAIGGLDERFGMGFFDDDDLALRARRAGFELAVAHDLFVHHFGSRTFTGNGVDAEALLEENARRFGKKWGYEIHPGHRVTLRSWTPSADQPSEGDGRREADPPQAAQLGADRDAGIQIPRSNISDWKADRPGPRAKVSLVMIVRDEEANLPRCLSSVQGIFDEIVVVDTGSTDRTAAIAREFGARVFDFVWVDDFAAARNAALARATGDYAFWLDADDLVEQPEREKLRELLASLPVAGTLRGCEFFEREGIDFC
jgi:GT2 family glycosyltransferase